MNSAILDARPAALFPKFLDACRSLGLDVAAVERRSRLTVDHLSGNAARRRSEMADWQELERRWYEALEAGRTDWSVYESDWYLAELWACWVVYSRTYLRSVFTSGIFEDLGIVHRVVDLGCGIGITTAALKQMFDGAEVVGTNIDGTVQTKIARWFGREFDFRVVDRAAFSQTDLVFASEFFEHIEEPVAYLRDVVATLSPRALVVANSFGARSIGHFPRYEVDGRSFVGRTISRRFNDELRLLGYEKMEMGLWNDRPSYWKRAA